MFNTLGALENFEKPAVFKLLESGRAFSACALTLSSLVMAGILLAISAYEFDGQDY